jgi:hypothetical protein
MNIIEDDNWKYNNDNYDYENYDNAGHFVIFFQKKKHVRGLSGKPASYVDY